MTETTWRCRCGEVRLRVAGLPREGEHIRCHCTYCRAHATRHGIADTLDRGGGVGLWQTTPEKVDIASGRERLRAERLSRHGPIRYHAECCGVPVANTAPRRGIPFVALSTAGLPDADLPPLAARSFPRDGTARMAVRPGAMSAYGVRILVRMARARWSGAWRETAFFDAHGHPLAAPERPVREARS